MEPLFYLITTTKCKMSDADNSHMPKRIHKVCPLNAKVKVLYLIRTGKKLSVEVAKFCSNSKFLSVKLWRRRNLF